MRLRQDTGKDKYLSQTMILQSLTGCYVYDRQIIIFTGLLGNIYLSVTVSYWLCLICYSVGYVSVYMSCIYYMYTWIIFVCGSMYVSMYRMFIPVHPPSYNIETKVIQFLPFGNMCNDLHFHDLLCFVVLSYKH